MPNAVVSLYSAGKRVCAKTGGNGRSVAVLFFARNLTVISTQNRILEFRCPNKKKKYLFFTAAEEKEEENTSERETTPLFPHTTRATGCFSPPPMPRIPLAATAINPPTPFGSKQVFSPFTGGHQPSNPFFFFFFLFSWLQPKLQLLLLPFPPFHPVYISPSAKRNTAATP